jgi:hypothetical protein
MSLSHSERGGRRSNGCTVVQSWPKLVTNFASFASLLVVVLVVFCFGFSQTNMYRESGRDNCPKILATIEKYLRCILGSSRIYVWDEAESVLLACCSQKKSGDARRCQDNSISTCSSPFAIAATGPLRSCPRGTIISLKRLQPGSLPMMTQQTRLGKIKLRITAISIITATSYVCSARVYSGDMSGGFPVAMVPRVGLYAC